MHGTYGNITIYICNIYKQYRAQDQPWYSLGAHKNFEHYLLLTPNNPFEIGHGNSLHKLMLKT